MRLFKFLLEHKIALLVVFIFLAARALLELALPTYTSEIVDVGIAQCVDAEGNLQLDYIIHMGALMMLTALGIFITNIISDLVVSRTSAKIACDLRRKLFKKITEFNNTEIDKFSSASLITRGTNDIQSIQNACVLIQRMVLFSPVMAVGGIIAVASSNLSMVWIIVLGVVLVTGVAIVLMSATSPKFKMMQKLIDRVNLIAREILNGLPVVRAFGREGYEEKRFDKTSKKLRRTQLFTNRVMTFMMPLMSLAMNLMSVLIVWVGGHAINDGTLQTGEMIAYISYSMIIVSSFLALGMVAMVLPRANVAATRVWEVITCEVSVKDGGVKGAGVGRADDEDATLAPSVTARDALDEGVTEKSATTNGPLENGASDATPALNAPGSHDPFVEFDNVSFRYAGAEANVLDAVSFSAERGKTTAIVGPTGCGKSTIIQLIERFYDANEGVVRVCGRDVRDMNLRDLREKFGYVPQKSFLFSGTVRSNVLYGVDDDSKSGAGAEACAGGARNANSSHNGNTHGGNAHENNPRNLRVTNARIDSTLSQSLKIAQADEFVSSLPEGDLSPITQGGTNVSGGQRQRLSIARAIATHSEAYLFDDSFSALDYKTDAALRAEMNKHLKGATIIIVAQRVATVMHADKIICMTGGKIAGQGTHAQLLQTCPEYYDIAAGQLSAEELSKSAGGRTITCASAHSHIVNTSHAIADPANTRPHSARGGE